MVYILGRPSACERNCQSIIDISVKELPGRRLACVRDFQSIIDMSVNDKSENFAIISITGKWEVTIRLLKTNSKLRAKRIYCVSGIVNL